MITTTAQITNHQNGHSVSIPTHVPAFNFTFGMHLVGLPNANHDLESHRSVPSSEIVLTNIYLDELARHMYSNMGGADFDYIIERLQHYNNE